MDTREQLIVDQRRKSTEAQMGRAYEIGFWVFVGWLLYATVKSIRSFVISIPIQILKPIVWLLVVLVISGAVRHEYLERQERRARRKIVRRPDIFN